MTTSGYGLSGIGLDPLGYTGLGVPGQYSSSLDSYMPSMAAYNPAFSGMNMGMAPGMLGMGGMMYPMMGGMMGGIDKYTEYLTKYQDAINQMEINKAKKTGAMQKIYTELQAEALKNSRISYMNQQKVVADEHEAVERLFEMINTSNFEDFTKEFDHAKEIIINKYCDKNDDKTNVDEAANNIIKTLYSEIASAKTGEVRDIISDIQRYGDGHIANGFMKGLRKGHHEQYVDEILCHCFGLPIDRKKSKDGVNDAMKYAGYGASFLEGGLIGGALATGAVTTGVGLLKPFCNIKFPKLKTYGRIAAVAGLVGGIVDLLWKKDVI